MLLSQIITQPDRYQFRDSPYSEQTVAAIVAEGVRLEKFDPLPLVASDELPDTFIVAGDGHSRYESIRRLARENRLPAAWADGADFDVPHRMVSADEATRLAWTANLSRDNLTPCEEAAVFQAMLDDGQPIDDVARLSHRSAGYVRKMLPLNALCRDIRQQVGKSPDAGGVENM